jgi:hypothetical protein
MQPGQPVPLDQVYARIVTTEGDSGQQKYCIAVAGCQLQAFSSLLENLDLLYKIFWVFQMKYTPAVNLVYRFLEVAVYKQHNGRVPSSVAELSAILCAFKKPDAI